MPATTDTKWNAHLYDDKHAFVFKYGEDLVKLLAPSIGEEILDLGCGTGHLTQLIAEAGADVTGVDSSNEMIEKARAAYPGLHFRVASATDLPYNQAFDAVFSNAVLHWVLDKELAIDGVYRSLRPGGRFVLEMGGKGNNDQVLLAIRKVLTRHGYYTNAATQRWYFPSLGEYTSLLEKRGFLIGYASHYDRETRLQDSEQGITDWIRMFCSDFFSNIPEDILNGLLEEVQDMLRPTHYRYQAWWADYKRLRVAATKQ
ncbi:MAG: methyltransferase domain-containing protein [Bacteroidota bacterium]|nr:methyltransferase domain-containing protein [Bacteroidota bacterium]MDP4216876.1 methyltransferase domain-containing protein [Bacteroidota bacterium]MDP4248273.1 methyltransferase domain-containing protein [Bacteroidota bacterium]MDP4252408.1 methyltransferase domain-containing protein [Bacteroidota bacterium]MDP4258586.1 methyltransferase domain-containing protein [Bacteroidota bacterium]